MHIAKWAGLGAARRSARNTDDLPAT